MYPCCTLQRNAFISFNTTPWFKGHAIIPLISFPFKTEDRGSITPMFSSYLFICKCCPQEHSNTNESSIVLEMNDSNSLLLEDAGKSEGRGKYRGVYSQVSSSHPKIPTVRHLQPTDQLKSGHKDDAYKYCSSTDCCGQHQSLPHVLFILSSREILESGLFPIP